MIWFLSLRKASETNTTNMWGSLLVKYSVRLKKELCCYGELHKKRPNRFKKEVINLVHIQNTQFTYLKVHKSYFIQHADPHVNYKK